jgi:hypothetical protein
MNTKSLEAALFDQFDDSSTTPVSIRLPNNLINDLDELSITLDKTKSFLINEFIKDGVKRTHEIIQNRNKDLAVPVSRDTDDFMSWKAFILNTNYNNDPESHFEMIKNQEAAAFVTGWKEQINNLSENDRVYLYQSGVGFIASGIVKGELIKSEYNGVPDEKFAKKLSDFKSGFKAISAREFKDITGKGTNFRATLSEMDLHQASKLDEIINKRL